MTMHLEILSPEKALFNGAVTRVSLPGSMAPFVVLQNHAPIMSVLSAGAVAWLAGDDEQRIEIAGGFAEVKDNCITVSVELPE